ncbi:UNKNOWN [Stylonychia lemnae]|uniref:Uncharacterized protein n=1 Tax=Stylonychia lemnae TaxID=5949 RepID=A0A078AYG7_STYLE|nr:UNKNOWN [Stylonychia lemnae]|eukprot:CDW87209.1 UNKNOWN [Stylonychia lemnae]
MDHQKNNPSVKLHQAPGGSSSFSFGWGQDEPKEVPKNKQPPPKIEDVQGVPQKIAQDLPQDALAKNSAGYQVRNQQYSAGLWDNTEEEKHSSVKLHQAPGGQSNFSLGNDTEDRFKTSNQFSAQNNQVAGFRGQQQSSMQESMQQDTQQIGAVKSSVRVHNPPGGRSQIQF